VLLPRRGIAPWAKNSEAGKDRQHPEAAAMRRMEGGNKVDEGTLAQGDRVTTLAHIGAGLRRGKKVILA